MSLGIAAILGARHGHDASMPAMNTSTLSAVASNAWNYEPSYFTHDGYSGWLMAHIGLMVVSWMFILPICVMLSISRSRLAFFAHASFIPINAAGMLTGFVYNVNTPDLYENNAHHKFGWFLTILVTIYAVISVLSAYTATNRPFPASHEIHYKDIEDRSEESAYRYSRDSGQGTEPSSPRHSIPSPYRPANEFSEVQFKKSESDAADFEPEHQGLLGTNAMDRFISHKLVSRSTSRLLAILSLCTSIIDRIILILGFVELSTGIVTYGGHFKGIQVLSGLAHFIKGGIFFWYGLLVLGRMMGSFADLGWSWNLKPSANIVGRRKANAPTAEFVESFLIFLYGSTNVFLEHLGSEDGMWSSTDLEHVSISIMFFGGGLCGMLIESRRVRDLLNLNLLGGFSTQGHHSDFQAMQQPKTAGFSINPMPAIIIMLLGKMMGGHHQTSMVSTMLHAQWGGLFAVAALARGVTYILLYLSPPSSYLPSRPPSELVVAFCLISGGLIFMSSNSDFVTGMEMYDLDAMFLFTVIMGFTAFLMAWEIIVLAIKGWAVRRERM